MHFLIASIEATGPWAPWIFLGIFLAASLVTVWRLESMASGGLEGTVIGTLITPYMTGLGNLVFTYVVARDHGPAKDVVTMCLINNVTNMTIVLGLPAVIWRLHVISKSHAAEGPARQTAKFLRLEEINRLSLLLSLLAVFLFTGVTWLLGADGRITFTSGLVLVGIFFLWQALHVFQVLHDQARKKRKFTWLLAADLVIFAIGAYAVYVSTDWLVNWVSNIHTGFISATYLGLLSGWLNVLPNAFLAVYYAWTSQPEVVYTTQSGDNHMCIPLCLGILALFQTIALPAFFGLGVIMILLATLVHFVCIAGFGRLPWFVGLGLTGTYAWFIYHVLQFGLMK